MNLAPTNNGLNMLWHGWNTHVSAQYCLRRPGQSSNMTRDHLKLLCISGGCFDSSGHLLKWCCMPRQSSEISPLTGRCVHWSGGPGKWCCMTRINCMWRLNKKCRDVRGPAAWTSPKKWKSVAKGWTVAGSKVFAYLRNPSPTKVQCLCKQEKLLRSDPMRIQDSLMAVWASLENWSGMNLPRQLGYWMINTAFFFPTTTLWLVCSQVT